jgi:hypothetical protein
MRLRPLVGRARIVILRQRERPWRASGLNAAVEFSRRAPERFASRSRRQVTLSSPWLSCRRRSTGSYPRHARRSAAALRHLAVQDAELGAKRNKSE